MDGNGFILDAAVMLGQFIAGAMVGWFGLFCESRALNRAEKSGAHWTLKARAAWPARVTANLHVYLVPAVLWSLRSHFGWAEDATLPWWLEGMAALLGTMLGAYPFEKKLFPEIHFRTWLHHLLAHWGVRLLMAWVFLACADSMPQEWSAACLAVVLVYLLFYAFCQFGGLLGLLRLMRFVVPADPALTAQAQEIAARAGIHVRKVWIMESVLANAMAFITTRELLFTRKLLQICSRDEVDAVCGHEVGHLSESKWVVAGRLVTGLVWTPFLFVKPALHQHGLTGLFVIGMVTMLISRLGRGLSMAMEHRADRAAAGVQVSEGVYASALAKIHEAGLIPAVLPGKGTTHPHLYDRLVAAGVPPSYPRPEPPARHTLWRFALSILFGFLIGPLLGELLRNPTGTVSYSW